MPLLMKKGEFATWMGVGASAVSNWAKKGLLVFGEDPVQAGVQLVDAEKSKILIDASVDRSRGRPSNASRLAAEAGGEPVAAEAATSARAPKVSEAELLRQDEARERIIGRRIENERSIGGLVPLAEYERRAGEYGRLVRERSHAVVRDLSLKLAAETNPRVIIAVLIEGLDKMFANLADEIEAAAKAELVADATLAAVEKAAETEDVEDG